MHWQQLTWGAGLLNVGAGVGRLAARRAIATNMRHEQLERLRRETFDVLVIGGGITGAGVAQDAAHRGLKVALVDKADFASGTTHASTKLLHGGLRYLEHGQLRLMYEALRERNRLTRLAPRLAEWLPFLIPLYGRGWRTDRIGAGLWLYDLLAGWPRGRTRRHLSAAEALALAPSLNREGLRGAWLYYDARTDDTRLTIAVLRSALQAGAAAANYVEATGFVRDGERIAGATVCDRISGGEFTIAARSVVNATGPWTDWTLALAGDASPGATPKTRNLAPSKGAHVLVPHARLPVTAAVLAPSPAGDNRFIFVVPWHGAVLLGTTDTPYAEHPDTARADDDDIDYILAAANTVFPAAELGREDVISTMAGLRPLLRSGGGGGGTVGLSREHRIWEEQPGLVTVAGGKLTTYRTMAVQVTDRVLHVLGRPRSRSRTATLPLDADRDAAIAALTAASPELAEPLVPGLPYTMAEAAFAVQAELAVTPADVLYRRTRAGLLDPAGSRARLDAVMQLIERFGSGAEGAAPVAGGVASVADGIEAAADGVDAVAGTSPHGGASAGEGGVS